MGRAFVLFALLSSCLSLGAAEIENDRLRLSIDNQGRLVSLTDRVEKRDWLAGGTTPLYGIQLVDVTKEFTSAEADKIDVVRKGQELVIECRHTRPVVATVVCRFQLRTDDVACRLEVSAAEPLRVSGVRFPIVSMALPLAGSAADDCVVLPYCDGCLLHDPLTNNADRLVNYPGGASLQMLAALNGRAGFMLAVHDVDVHTKQFMSRVRAKRLEWFVVHQTPQAPAKQWRQAYDVVLCPLHAAAADRSVTWEDAADRYRAWATKQKWCAQTLADRLTKGDVPKWLIRPSLYYAYSLRGEDAKKARINRLPLVPGQAESWRHLLGAPATMMLMSWEKRDSWFTPDYFPPFGGTEDFKAATAELHRSGHHTLVFLSGLKWTLRKEHAPPGKPPLILDDEEAFRKLGADSALSGPDGQPIYYGEPSRDVGRHAQICPTTELARKILLDSTRKCQELGIDCVQVDQIVGGGMPACYHPAHQHPPGGGNWETAAIYKLFAELRAEGKRRSRDFAFAIEEPAEYLIPLLDCYHARDYQQGRWPRSGAGIEGVPLFTHVYHDYVLGYGGDSCFVSQWPSPHALYGQGMNLVCGKAAGVAVWTRWYEPEKTDPVQARLLKGHATAWNGPLRDFLIFGQRGHDLPLEVPMQTITFSEKDTRKRSISLPTVLHGVWQLGDTRRVVVLVGVGDKPVQISLAGARQTIEPGQVQMIELTARARAADGGSK